MQAMRWWFKQQTIALSTHADQIQNGLLQDLFAIRLRLQAPLSEQSEDGMSQQQAWISEAKKLHDQLTHLNEALIPPYLAESLPLAIQSLLKQWELSHPHNQLRMDLPYGWRPEPLERSWMILKTLETLLNLAISASLPHVSLEVTLIDQSPQAELQIKVTYPDRLTHLSLTRTRELKYLCHCFRCLAPGRCFYYSRALTAVWRFQWNS